MSVRFGIDTGGTFTDFVRFGPDGLTVHKVRSTPADPSRAILAGIAEMASGGHARASKHTVASSREQSGATGSPRVGAPGEPGDGGLRVNIVHGSTVATNAVL